MKVQYFHKRNKRLKYLMFHIVYTLEIRFINYLESNKILNYSQHRLRSRKSITSSLMEK